MNHYNFDSVLDRPRLACSSCKTYTTQCVHHPICKDVLRTNLVDYEIRKGDKTIVVKSQLKEKIFCPISSNCQQVIIVCKFVEEKSFFRYKF